MKTHPRAVVIENLEQRRLMSSVWLVKIVDDGASNELKKGHTAAGDTAVTADIGYASGYTPDSDGYVRVTGATDAIDAIEDATDIVSQTGGKTGIVTTGANTGTARSSTSDEPAIDYPYIYGFEDQTGSGADDDYNDFYVQIEVKEDEDDCGCCEDGKAGGSDSKQGSNSAPSASSQPINYVDGSVQYTVTDLSSGGFGDSWGHARSWTNKIGQAGANLNGNGFRVNQLAELKQSGSGSNQVVQIIRSGNVSSWFTGNGTTWTPLYYRQDSLTKTGSGTAERWVWTTSTGETYQFYTSTNATVIGKLASVSDPAGPLTSLNWNTSTGVLNSVTRQDASSNYERFRYEYVASGTNAGLIDTVWLERSTDGTTYTTVRYAEYEYYTGAAGEFGRAGDLQTATVRSATGQTIDAQYYRYHRSSTVGSVTRTAYNSTTRLATVQVSLTGHGLQPGDRFTLTGANEKAYNGDFVVSTVVDSNTFKFFTLQSGSGYAATATATITLAARGYDGGLKMVFGTDAVERLQQAYPSDWETRSDADVLAYVSNYYEYDSARRAVKEIAADAGCSSCTNGQGTFKLEYIAKERSTSDFNTWARKTIETLPDNSQNVVYQNSSGQTMLTEFREADVTQSITQIAWAYNSTSKITTATVTQSGHGYSTGDKVLIQNVTGPLYAGYFNGVFTITVTDANTYTYTFQGQPKTDGTATISVSGMTANKIKRSFLTYWKYDTNGRMVLKANPSAVTGYDESEPDLLDFSSFDQATYLKSDDGLVEVWTYHDTATDMSVDDDTAGDVLGYLKSYSVQRGKNTSSRTDVQAYTYFRHAVGSTYTYPVATSTVYEGTGGGSPRTTTFGYEWFTSSHQIKKRTVTLPTASTGKNGSGLAVSEVTYFDKQGRAIWVVDREGFTTFNEYDQNTGSMVRQITDADPANTTLIPNSAISDFADVGRPTRTPSAAALNLVTTMGVDNLGRVTKVTDPNGNVTYTVYNDTAQERRVYPGWNATTGLTTGPTQVIREDRAGKYAERLTMSATPSTSGSAGSYVPTGTESISNLQSLTRDIVNDAGQVIYRDVYTTGGLTYSTNATIGSAGTDYLRTEFGYDDRGRQSRVKRPDGTWTHTVYDGLGRAVSTWKGTDNTDWKPTNPAGSGGSNNMVKVSEKIYDNGGIGDSNLTESRQVVGNGATAGTDFYATKYQYDFRNRMTAMRGADKVATHYTFDNLGQHTQIDIFADTDEDFDTGDSTQLRGRTIQAFDERGQLYSTTTHEVDNAADSLPGTIRDGFTNEFWYDARGNLIKSVDPSGRIDKTFYDGARRVVRAAITADPTEITSATYAEADDLTDDQVIEQYDYWLDAGGRTRISTTWMRDGRESSTIKGASAGHFDHNSVAYFYDAANRLVSIADYGRDGAEQSGTTYVWNSTGLSYKDSDTDGIPNVIDTTQDNGPGLHNSSSPTNYDWIYTTYAYDAAGRLHIVTDNANRKTHTLYDLAGRTTDVIENYVNGVASDTETDTDRTTEYVYDTSGRLWKQIAYNPKGSGNGVEQQTTVYLYTSALDRSWLTSTVYPDSSDTPNTAKSVTSLTQTGGTATAAVTSHGYVAGDVVAIEGANQGLYLGMFVVATVPDANHFTFTIDGSAPASASGVITATKVSGKDMVSTIHDRLGRAVSTIDQRGVVHTFSYDSSGRLVVDTATNLMSGVDSRVQRIGYTYDDLSRTQNVTSYADTAASTVVNDVQYEYDGWGNVTKTYQAHDGAVNTSSTPFIEYIYEDGGDNTSSGVADYVRLYQVNYPDNNGGSRGSFRPIYETSYDVGEVLNRIHQIRQASGTQLVEYRWIGAATLIHQILHPSISGGLQMYAGAKSNDYFGWDRYYRQTTVLWRNTSAGVDFERRAYTYDRMGNRLSMDNNGSGGGASDWDESYAYDGLNRLTNFKLGTITSGVMGTPRFEQSWTLDSLGNWTRLVQTNASSGTKALNAAAFPTYDRSRTNNAVNEISSIVTTGTSTPVGAQPAYDASGSMTQAPKTDDNSVMLTLKYDAWNRQASLDKNGDGDLFDAGDWQYEYDGIGRRISKWQDTADDGTNSAGSGEEYFYNESSQMVEMRVATTASGSKSVNANPKERILWDLTYIDSPAMIELDDDLNGTRDHRLWATWDANYNVTALLTDAGKTVERYAYTPYGQQILINGDGTVDSDGNEWTVDINGSDFGFVASGFQGLRFDAESGNWYQRARYSSPVLQFTQRDPLGYVDGMSLYGFLGQDPLNYVDPLGLEAADAETRIGGWSGINSDGDNYVTEFLQDTLGRPNVERSLSAMSKQNVLKLTGNAIGKILSDWDSIRNALDAERELRTGDTWATDPMLQPHGMRGDECPRDIWVLMLSPATERTINSTEVANVRVDVWYDSDDFPVRLAQIGTTPDVRARQAVGGGTATEVDIRTWTDHSPGYGYLKDSDAVYEKSDMVEQRRKIRTGGKVPTTITTRVPRPGADPKRIGGWIDKASENSADFAFVCHSQGCNLLQNQLSLAIQP